MNLLSVPPPPACGSEGCGGGTGCSVSSTRGLPGWGRWSGPGGLLCDVLRDLQLAPLGWLAVASRGLLMTATQSASASSSRAVWGEERGFCVGCVLGPAASAAKGHLALGIPQCSSGALGLSWWSQPSSSPSCLSVSGTQTKNVVHRKAGGGCSDAGPSRKTHLLSVSAVLVVTARGWE